MTKMFVEGFEPVGYLTAVSQHINSTFKVSGRSLKLGPGYSILLETVQIWKNNCPKKVFEILKMELSAVRKGTIFRRKLIKTRKAGKNVWQYWSSNPIFCCPNSVYCGQPLYKKKSDGTSKN